MTTDSMLLSLERASRLSAVLMALGAAIVASALWIAASRLTTIQAEVTELEARAESLRAKNRDLEQKAIDLAKTSDSLSKEVTGLREALSASRDAIAAFHARDYATAVRLYGTALAADPGNAYLMNLKAYSLFKLGDLPQAIDVQQRGLQVDPGYAWGLFDLARFQCASGDKAAAAKSLSEAITKDSRFRQLAEQDGEFRRLCGSLTQ
jgi:tetratricopeptide (TPR) repeat protein